MFTARYNGKCPCGNHIQRGDPIGWIDGEVCCGGCVDAAATTEPPTLVVCPDCHLQHVGECW